jgi:hypothetical protein
LCQIGQAEFALDLTDLPHGILKAILAKLLVLNIFELFVQLIEKSLAVL